MELQVQLVRQDILLVVVEVQTLQEDHLQEQRDQVELVVEVLKAALVPLILEAVVEQPFQDLVPQVVQELLLLDINFKINRYLLNFKINI